MKSMLDRAIVILIVAIAAMTGGSVRFEYATGLKWHISAVDELYAGGSPNLIFRDGFEAPPVVLESPPDGSATCNPEVVLTGTVSPSVVQLLINSIDVPIIDLQFTSPAIPLDGGLNILQLQAILSGGGSYIRELMYFRVDPPNPVNALLIDVTVPDGGSTSITGYSLSVDANTDITITNTRTSGSVQAQADGNGAFSSEIGAVPGDELSLVVEKSALCPSSEPVNVLVPDTNHAPTLDAIGNQVVDLGQLLHITLTGSDPDDDSLSFMGFPLPPNASLDGSSGQFLFAPKEGQEGVHQVEFAVSDGSASDTEVISITVNGAPAEGITELSGRVLDTNDWVESGVETPVVGATVSILNSGITALTGEDGSFTLSPIPAGAQIFDINPAGTVAPDNSDYAGFREAIHIIDKVDNQATRPFYLPRIAMDSITTVNPNATTIVENVALGVRIEIPAHTAKWIDGSDYAGPVSISEVPGAIAPAALPPELGFGLLVTIQPVGLYFVTPIPIYFPNGDGLPEGDQVDIWSLDAGTGKFTVVGIGEVINNEIKTVSGGVMAADWHGPLASGATQTKGEDNENCDNCQRTKAKTGSETSLGRGSLTVRHDLVPYQSVGQWRAPSLVYNSSNADPRPVVTTTAIMPGPKPARMEMKVLHQGIAGANTVVYDTSASSPLDPVKLAGQFDASMLPTGVHDYSLEIRNTFAFSSVITRQAGSALINNLSQSPIGSGWGVEGIDRLFEQSDQSVVMASGDGSVRIYPPLFEGSGKFVGPDTRAIGTWTGARPISVDLNHDDTLDLIVGSIGYPSIPRLEIFLNDGSGNFSYSQFITRESPEAFALADFNHDTHLDAVIIGVSRADIHLGDGAGGFGAPVKFSDTVNGLTNNSVTVADFNKDTHLDIAYGNDYGALSGQNISVQLGDGLGGFGAQLNMEIAAGGTGEVISADFNKDTKPDIAVVATNAGAIAIFLGDGAGGFAAPVETPSGSSPRLITSGDFDGDTNIDLAVGLTSSISILMGNGDATFSSPSVIPVISLVRGILAGNFDGNSNPDIAVATDSDGGIDTLTLLDGNGLGGFPVRRLMNSGYEPNSIVAGDFNGDLLDDIAVVNGNGARTVSIHLSDGPNNLQQVGSVPRQISGSTKQNGIVVADFNEDRIPDAVLTRGINFVELYLGDGQSLNFPTATLVGQNYGEVVTADFNADGHADLAFVAINSPDDGIRVRLGDGQGGLDTEVFTVFPASPPIFGAGLPFALTTGDLNADGLPDLVIRNTTDGSQQQITPMQGNGDGSFTLLTRIDVSSRPIQSRIADVTEDGIADIITYNTAEVVHVFPGDGDGGFGAPVATSIGTSAFSFDIGDVNGDQIPDVVTGRDSGGPGGQISIGIGDGTGSFTHTGDTPVCIANDAYYSQVGALTLADLDNDGDQDLAFTCRHNFTLSTAINDGNGVFTAQDHLMTNGANFNLAVGDFNLDGAADLVSASGVGLDIALNIPTATRVGLRSPASDFSILTPNPDGSYTRRLKNGTVIEFDSDGLQTSVTDRNGNATFYDYDGLDRLIRITDPIALETTFAYTGDHLSSITDPVGRVTQFGHDGNGNLTSITDPDLSVRQFGYDNRHRLTGQTSKRGFKTRYDYDKYGANWRNVRADNSTNLIQPFAHAALPAPGSGTASNPMPAVLANEAVARWTDGRGGVTEYRTNLFDSATEMTDQLGRTSHMLKNGENLLSRQISPNGREDVFSYDRNGNLVSQVMAQGSLDEQHIRLFYELEFNQPVLVVDAAGNPVSMEYDPNGNLTQLRDQLLQDRLFTYNAQGQPLTVTDPNTNLTTFTYDALGNVDSVENALLHLSTIQRDAAGRITGVTEGVGTPEERSIAITWDSMNRVVSLVDGENAESLVRYFPDGLLKESETPTGEITAYTYDSRDRLVSVLHPVRGLTTLAYDQNDNLVSTNNDLNQTTIFHYDLADQLVRQVDAIGGEELFDYDLQGNLIGLTDERNNETTFEYDLLDRLKVQTNPLTQAVSFEYDTRDLLISRTDARGNVSEYVYDALSRLLEATTPDNLTAYTYDPAGNLLTVEDDDSSLQFTYDALNRVKTANTLLAGIQPVTTLTYTYDAVGNRVQMDDSEGGVTQYEYDDAARLTQVTTPALDVIIQDYDPTGRLTRITNPNDIVSDYVYDALGRLESINHEKLLGPVLANYSYTYNGIGNITSITDLVETRTFSYDPLQRLTAAGTAAQPEDYTYDPVGNRVTSHISAGHDTDAANRLLEDDDFVYTYDEDGNLASKTTKIGNEVTSYAFNASNQLVEIVFPDLTTATYAYDGLGRRIEKNVDGLVTRYIYDGLDLVLEFDGTDALLAQYTHGSRIDQPLSMERGGQSYFYHADHLGSIRKLTDSSGIEVNSYTYDAYGRLEEISESIPNPFTYTGREYDAESGLYYYRARYYDPQTGRFVSEDPIGLSSGDKNLFRYVLSNPVNLTDPSGLGKLWEYLKDAGIAVGATVAVAGAIILSPLAVSVVAATAIAGTVVVVGSTLYRGRSEFLQNYDEKKALEEKEKEIKRKNPADLNKSEIQLLDAQYCAETRYKKIVEPAQTISTAVPGTTLTGTPPSSAEDLVVEASKGVLSRLVEIIH